MPFQYVKNIDKHLVNRELIKPRNENDATYFNLSVAFWNNAKSILQAVTEWQQELTHLY